MLKKIRKIVVGFSLAFCLFSAGCLPRFLVNSPSRLVGFEVDYASNLNINRRAHTATLLKNGDLFIAGGETYIAELDRFVPLNRCEIYDVKKEMFLNNATLDNPRSQHTATLLENGKVLIAGGKNGSQTLFYSELYNPSQNMSVAASPLENSRYAHTATLIANGFVLLANGNSGKKPLSTVEVYSPLANSFKLVGRTHYKGANRTATLLKNGFILFTGGWYTENGALYYNKGAELYDPVTNISQKIRDMRYARGYHTATLLDDGRVLIAGGRNYTGDLKSVEIYDPSTERFYLTGSMKEARSSHAAIAVGSALVMITGGQSGGRVLASAEIYNVSKGRFGPLEKLNTPRKEHTLTLLNSGGYLLVGGDFGEKTKKVELNQLAKVGEIIKIITN